MTRSIAKDHQSIAAWLENMSAHALPEITPAEPALNKSGVLPFVPTGSDPAQWRFLLMRPQAEHPELPPPLLQICKGTRMGLRKGKWRDISKQAKAEEYESIEPLLYTALREGIEELGLMLEGITSLVDAGTVNFLSSRSGKPKPLYLYLAEMQHEEALLPMEEVEPSTAERRWLSLEEFYQQGRQDHAEIVHKVLRYFALPQP